jgi:hypothetical protein
MFKVGQIYKIESNEFLSICPCNVLEVTKIENIVSGSKRIYYLCDKLESSFHSSSYFSTKLRLIKDTNNNSDDSTNKITESKQTNNLTSVRHKALF